MGVEVKEIPYKIRAANTFFSRLRGLMFKRQPIKNEGLWIVPCNSIHMFFMSFPIDAVFLNEKNNVVSLYPKLKPWQMTKPNKYAYSVLELPAGAIKEIGIEMGDVIKISNIR